MKISCMCTFKYRLEFDEKFYSYGPYALWATEANFVMRYGSLHQIWLYAMGHYSEFFLNPSYQKKIWFAVVA
jgi:hypothetical protein